MWRFLLFDRIAVFSNQFFANLLQKLHTKTVTNKVATRSSSQLNLFSSYLPKIPNIKKQVNKESAKQNKTNKAG